MIKVGTTNFNFTVKWNCKTAPLFLAIRCKLLFRNSCKIHIRLQTFRVCGKPYRKFGTASNGLVTENYVIVFGILM